MFNWKEIPLLKNLLLDIDRLLDIDPDLHAYSNTIEKQCNKYDTSEDFRLKYGVPNIIFQLFIQTYVASRKI